MFEKDFNIWFLSVVLVVVVFHCSLDQRGSVWGNIIEHGKVDHFVGDKGIIFGEIKEIVGVVSAGRVGIVIEVVFVVIDEVSVALFHNEAPGLDEGLALAFRERFHAGDTCARDGDGGPLVPGDAGAVKDKILIAIGIAGGCEGDSSKRARLGGVCGIGGLKN